MSIRTIAKKKNRAVEEATTRFHEITTPSRVLPTLPLGWRRHVPADADRNGNGFGAGGKKGIDQLANAIDQ
jgi:hypothetical protein